MKYIPGYEWPISIERENFSYEINISLSFFEFGLGFKFHFGKYKLIRFFELNFLFLTVVYFTHKKDEEFNNDI